MNNRKSQEGFFKCVNDWSTTCNLNVPTREPRHHDETGGPRQSIVAIHYVLLLAAVLFFVPVPSFADGCATETHVDIQWGPPTYAQWIVTNGRCTSASEALQACIAFIEQLGLEADNTSCGSGYNGVYQAGWFYGGAFYPNNYFGSFISPHFFVSVYPQSQCDICVGDPINPAGGAVFLSEADANGQSNDSLTFKRFYNSTRPGIDFSIGWRHSFSRSVKPVYSAILYRAYQSDPNNSYLYEDATTACTSGFVQVKGRVVGWGDATSSYANGLCSVMANGTVIGVMRVYSTIEGAPFGGPVVTGIDATRDDGELISFYFNGTSIVAPPSINLKLLQTSSGYTLTDANDAIETYDTNGKLLSITSRTGVVQTMSYNTAGRLSGVSDTFGHQLILSYDSSNRLSTVTRQ